MATTSPPAGALVFITSAYDDPEPITAFRNAAAADKHGRHHVTGDPAAADLILFIENSHYHHDPFFKELKSHPLVGQYPNKVFMYNPHDVPWFVLPGLYACMRAQTFDSALMAACSYLEKINEYIYCDYGTEPTHLYSFYGSLKMPVRRELRHLRHPRGVVKDWTTGLYRPDKPKEPQLEYADLLADSKFVLCPRGLGTSSSRLFETMQAGRVPVIISDDWVRPQGPVWDELAVFVPESKIDQIPRLLEEAEARWPAMARRSRAAWEEFFAPDAVFHYFIEQLLPLRPPSHGMRLALALYHRVQFAKFYLHFKVLQRAKRFAKRYFSRKDNKANVRLPEVSSTSSVHTERLVS